MSENLHEQIKLKVSIDTYLAAEYGTVFKQTGDGKLMCSCPDPGHPDKNPSCSIDLDKKVINCFVCAKGGSIIDLVAWLHESTEQAAFDYLLDYSGLKQNPVLQAVPDGKSNVISKPRYFAVPKNIPPIVAGTPIKLYFNSNYIPEIKPELSHPYYDRDKKLSHYVIRGPDTYPKGERQKNYYPAHWGKVANHTGWIAKKDEAKNLLYGAERYDPKDEKTVLIVEGEKCVDWFYSQFPQLSDAYVCLSSQGGSAAVGNADWSMVKSRTVVIWADNDQGGRTAKDKLIEIFKKQGCGVLAVDETQLEKEKDDIADIDSEEVVTEHLANAKVIVELWRTKILITKTGEPVKYSTDNAMLFLQHHKDLEGIIGFDHTFSNVILDHNSEEIKLIEIKGEPFPRTLRQNDVNKIVAWLERQGVFIAAKTIKSLIKTISMDNQYDSLFDWLDGLEWDKNERIDNFFAEHLKVKPSKYTMMISRLFFLSLVSRRLDPGGKMDYYFILEGQGGQHKGEFLKTLGGKYYKEGLPDFRGKEFYYFVRDGAWIVEDDEMNLQRRADSKSNKGFITRQRDEQRVVYEDDTTKVERAFVLVGTTNDHGKQYLEDQTGNRRYLPVHVCPNGGKIDYHAVEKIREQLFAEAAYYFKLYQKDLENGIAPGDSPNRWWLDEGDEKVAQGEQDVRTTENPDVDMIQYGLEQIPGFKNNLMGAGLPVMKIYQILNDGRSLHSTKSNQFKSALKLVGLVEHKRKRVDGKVEKSALWGFPT